MVYKGKIIYFLQRTLEGDEVRCARIMSTCRNAQGRPYMFRVRMKKGKEKGFTGVKTEVMERQVSEFHPACGIMFRGKLVSC